MITKFEKKIIAGLMSLVLCLTIVLSVPVYAKAEEAQDVTEEKEIIENEDIIPNDIELAEETTPELVSEVKDIELGMQETLIENGGQQVKYRLTVEKTGMYSWASYNPAASISCYDTNNHITYGISSRRNQKLEKGITYEISVKFTDPTETGSIQWEVDQLNELEIQEGEMLYTDPMDKTYYKFVPNESGKYKVESFIEVYDAEWNPCFLDVVYRTYDMKAGETYYMIYRYGNMEMRWWSVQKLEFSEKEEVKVQEGETYTKEQGKYIKYTFIPEESAYYHIWSENDTASISIKETGDEIGKPVFHQRFDRYSYMEKGKAYEVDVLSTSNESIIWHIKKADVKTVIEEKVYTMLKGESVDYTFVPEKTGYYVFEFSEVVYATFYDDNRNYINSTISHEDEAGFGQMVRLEKGKTYHIQMVGNSEQITWKIQFTQENEEYAYRTLPDDTIEIVKYLGENTNIVIPEKVDNKFVTSIGGGAFESNQTIEAVTVPSKVTILQYGAFAYCGNLKNVAFGEESALKEIGPQALKNCHRLTECNLPDSVKKIKDFSFKDCSNLKEIHLGKELVELGERAFSFSGLNSVIIPDGLKKAGRGAFYDCRYLAQVELGSGLEGIAEDMFSNCAKLEQLTLPENITYIGNYGFLDTGIKEITMPDSISAIGRDAFAGTAWYDVQSDGDVYVGKVYYKHKGEIPENTTIQIKDGTKGIAGGAFEKQRNLSKIEIPESVTNIGDYAFVGCSSMKEIMVPENVETIGTYAMGYLDVNYQNKYKIPDFKISGMQRSAAEIYAKENGLVFEAIGVTYIRGDVDMNGNVDVADMRMTLRSLTKKIELNETQKIAADVETDDVIDIKDLRKILRFVCNKIEEL